MGLIHPKQKFGVARKSDIDHAQYLSGEILDKEVMVTLPFSLMHYGGSFHTVDGTPSEVAIGLVMERMSQVIEELERAYWVETGRDYKYANVGCGPCRDEDDGRDFRRGFFRQCVEKVVLDNVKSGKDL